MQSEVERIAEWREYKREVLGKQMVAKWLARLRTHLQEQSK